MSTPDRWKQIETLFHAALEKPEKERSRYLDAVCADDGELRVAVETLLRRDGIDDFMEGRTGVTPGTRLGSYEVLAPLGRGGMGEVWRARDTTLGREVAIKTLPPEFARDADRLLRFEREARLLAALNHPNVAAIYGLEQHEGSRFLVLELVEGDTLADRLERGAVPVEESLKLAIQIAEALETAHEKGVIHRDLKPANIKVTPEGKVKVLDFGLAKAFTPEQGGANLADSPTLSVAATGRGIILGTAGYMSPEQASGLEVDARSDVWAFGVVLFEMLTGRRLFTGETVAHVLASVMKLDPDWSLLPGDLDPRIRFLLERCLEKEARDRCQGIGEARAEIRRALAAPATAAGPAPTPQPANRSMALLWIPAAIVLAVVSALVGWSLRPGDPRPVTRYVFDATDVAGDAAPPLLDGVQRLAVSPDGERQVLTLARQIYLRDRNEEEFHPIPDVAGFIPAFSPDGEWLAYVQPVADAATPTQVIRKLPLAGGGPQTLVTLHLAALPDVVGLDLEWDARDMLTYVLPDGIWQVSASGGAEPERIVTAAEGERLSRPQVLPGGSAILFSTRSGSGAPARGNPDGSVVVQTLDSRRERTLVRELGRDARYVPDGRIIYARGRTLYGIRFDPASFEVSGGEAVLVEGISYGRTAHYAISSESGDLVYMTGDFPAGAVEAEPQRELVWVDRAGNEDPLPMPADFYTRARISPDGSQVALVVGQTTNPNQRFADLWIYDLETQDRRPLTVDPNPDDSPVWSWDSQSLYFRSFRGEADDLPGVYRISIDDGEIGLVARDEGFVFASPWSLSPDGGTLAVLDADNTGRVDISTLDVDGGGGFQRMIDGGQWEGAPTIAPDGRWIAYMASETIFVEAEMIIRPFPDAGRQLFPVGPGSNPVFSPDGSELFFWLDDAVWVVPIRYAPMPDIGTRQELFTWPFDSPGERTWDAHPDGERFLMLRNVGGPPRPVRIHVVHDWIGELVERLPLN